MNISQSLIDDGVSIQKISVRDRLSKESNSSNTYRRQPTATKKSFQIYRKHMQTLTT